MQKSERIVNSLICQTDLLGQIDPQLETPWIRDISGMNRHFCMDDASPGTHPLDAAGFCYSVNKGIIAQDQIQVPIVPL
jgi:hypothetical protein